MCTFVVRIWLKQVFSWCGSIIFEPMHDKTNKMMCAQRSLRSARAFTQSDQSSLCAQWVAKDPKFPHADGWTRCIQADLSLRWAQVVLMVFSCGGSFSSKMLYIIMIQTGLDNYTPRSGCSCSLIRVCTVKNHFVPMYSTQGINFSTWASGKHLCAKMTSPFLYLYGKKQEQWGTWGIVQSTIVCITMNVNRYQC